MKKTIILAAFAILFCTAAQAQSDTTVVNGDTVIHSKGAIVINPVIVNANGDTAYSITWSTFGLANDTTKGCSAYVVLHGRNNQNLADFNVQIPSSVTNVWLDNSVIDDYILSKHPRLKRYTKK